MSAPIWIGEFVTVDEVSEAAHRANLNRTKDLDQTQDLNRAEDENYGAALNSGERSEIGLNDVQYIPPAIYEVKFYDLLSDTVTLKSNTIDEVDRKVSRNNIVKLTEHLELITSTALAEHRKTTAAELQQNAPVPANDVDADAAEEAQRRTKIMARHCAKINPISKKQAIEELNVGPTSFHDIKRTHLANPDWHAQLPGNSGRRAGEKRIDPEIEEIIARAFVTHRKGYGANDAEVMDEIGFQCRELNKHPPSRTTVWRRWNELSAKEQLASSDGPVAANARYGAFPTPTVTEYYPGRIHEIDHTPLDCHATDSKTGAVLGRANLTVVWDVDIEGFFGFALLFGAPKRASISAAVHMALCPKTDLLARHGLSHLHWPLYCKPRQYRVDHGSDLMAYSFRDACRAEEILHVPRLRPQSGGGVERALGILNRRLSQTLDGGTASAPKKGPGYKPGEKAVYTLERLTAIIIAWICKWNNRKGRDGLSPNERFERKYGVHDGVVIAPPTVADPDRFVIDILQGHEITIARNGVVTRNLVYEFGPFRGMVGAPIIIKIDPNNLHRIWGRNGDYWHPLNIVNKQDAAKTLSEHKLILKARRQDRDADNKRFDAHQALNGEKAKGKNEHQAIIRAQEDVAQIERMGHFGTPKPATSDEVPAASDEPYVIVVLEMDEDL